MTTDRTSALIVAYRRYLHTADTSALAMEIDEVYTASTLVALLRRGDADHRRAAALVLGLTADQSVMLPLGRSLSDPDRLTRTLAEDSLQALLVRDAPPTHRQQLRCVWHLVDGDEYAAALPIALRICDQVPHYAEGHRAAGTCWMGLGRFDDAEASLRRCVAAYPYHHHAWQLIARSCTARGDLPGAIEALTRCLAIKPDVEIARLQRRRLRRQWVRRGEAGR